MAQGGVKELAQGGDLNLVKSPRKVKEDRKRERDYDEEFPVLLNTNNTKYMDHKVGEVSVVAQGGVKKLAQGGSWTLVKSPRKIKEDRKRENLLRQERELMRKKNFGKNQVKVVVSNSKPGFCHKEEDFPPMEEEEQGQSNNCGPGARHQERGFLRYKGGDESEIGQGGDVNVLLLEERNDVSMAIHNEHDQVFAPRMQNKNNNCLANTCLSILGNTPEGLGQIKIFINKEHQNSQDIELGKLMKDAVHSSSIKKPINLCKLIPLIDPSLQLGEQEDIYPFISNLSEKLGFGEGTIFPKTDKKVSSCEKCGVESITLNPTSIVTLFFMNGKNVLDEFRTGLQQTVEKMCYTCGENTNHKQIQILEKSDYLMLRSLNDYSEKEVDLIKEIENIGILSLVGFATRKGDATGKSGHWWYTRVMHDGTSVKLDGEKLHHQNNIITSRSLSDGNLFVYKILPKDASFSLNPPTTVCVDFPKVVGFEDVGYKKVCISYQNEGNEKIIDIVHGKSMVSGLDSVVLTVKRITCVVSGCFSTFSRNDVMLRHLWEKHKMQRDDPIYPGNQSFVFGDKGKDGGEVGPDPKPTQVQDTVGEGGEVGAQILDTEGVDMELGSESEPAQDQYTDVECSELSDSEPEPSKKKKKRSQRQRSALHIENYSSDDSEEETSSEFSNEFSLSKVSCLEELVGEDADDFENMGYSGNAEDSFVQNSLQEDRVSGNTLGNYENSIFLEEDVGVSFRKSISQVFDSSILDNNLVKFNENFDEDCAFDQDKSEHSLIQDSMEGGLGVEESKSDSVPSEKLELLKQKLKSISDEIKRIEKEKKRKNDGKSMIIKAKISKIDKLSKKNDIKKSHKKPGVVLVSVSCSYCDKAFSSVFNLKRHIVSIHNIAEATVRELNFEATSKKCLHCGKWQKNLAKHVKICSKKKELDDKIEARPVHRIAILADGGVKSHVQGGILFMERIEEWYEHHSKQTRSMYLRKIKNILHYWEANTPNFIVSKLLYPLEYNISLPTLDRYLKTQTDSAKATSMKAYMQICDFVNDNLRNRYSADENYSPLMVSTWANEVLSFKHAMSGKLKSVNKKASLNTILSKKASREKYGDSDLKQNAVRCKVLYRILNQHSGIQEELQGIIKMSPCKLATHWDEKLRSFLVGLLIVTGG